jgi:hypothetical protein
MGNPAGIARRVSDAHTAGNPEALRRLYDQTAKTRCPAWPDDGGVDELVAIVAERQYWNMVELLAQLGMFVPMPEG